jgi:lipase
VSAAGASEPFARSERVPVAGGMLHVARTELCPRDADVIVLAIHGIASSHMVWRPTVRALAEQRVRACVLAPDLRGRGRSAGLPGPYGFAAARADLLAVLDHADVERAVLVGHSMGAYLAGGLAAAHPERAAAVVLIDGGLAVPSSFERDADELIEAMLHAALQYAGSSYATAADYLAAWQAHPAFAGRWNHDIDAYVRYELTGRPATLKRAVSHAAVRADITDLVCDEPARAAIDRVRAPISLLTAPRGMHNDYAVLPTMLVDAFAATHPHAHIERIPDTNHYTILLEPGPGPTRTATAITGGSG